MGDIKVLLVWEKNQTHAMSNVYLCKKKKKKNSCSITVDYIALWKSLPSRFHTKSGSVVKKYSRKYV